MRILYIDTSSSYLYTAIIEDDKTLIELKQEYDHQLSERAMLEIANMFDTANIYPKDIDKIIVVNGPGSFTGIRIGITIAKVYAWSLNIPISMVTSLEAMAISCDKKSYKVPVLDARRGYVYTGIYNENNEEVLSPRHIKLEELLNEINKLENYVIISNDELPIDKDICSYDPNIQKIVNLTKNRKTNNPHEINPSYLKRTEAEEKHDN